MKMMSFIVLKYLKMKLVLLLVGEANIIDPGSFYVNVNKSIRPRIKRYGRVANRRGPNFPWFISDELGSTLRINIELPMGNLLEDMKPQLNKKQQQQNVQRQPPIDEYFVNSSAGFLADERLGFPTTSSIYFPMWRCSCSCRADDSDLVSWSCAS